MQAEAFRELDADLFLANQLFKHGARSTVLSGATSATERKGRIRTEITSRDWADRPVLDGYAKPTGETLSTAFARLYGEPL